MTIASKSVRRSYYYYYYPYYKEKERKVNFRTRFFLMLANEFLAFEHSPLFFVDIIIHCSLLRTCRVRVEEKEEFLVYTVLWTLTCHPYLESATALSDTACACASVNAPRMCSSLGVSNPVKPLISMLEHAYYVRAGRYYCTTIYNADSQSKF